MYKICRLENMNNVSAAAAKNIWVNITREGEGKQISETTFWREIRLRLSQHSRQHVSELVEAKHVKPSRVVSNMCSTTMLYYACVKQTINSWITCSCLCSYSSFLLLESHLEKPGFCDNVKWKHTQTLVIIKLEISLYINGSNYFYIVFCIMTLF